MLKRRNGGKVSQGKEMQERGDRLGVMNKLSGKRKKGVGDAEKGSWQGKKNIRNQSVIQRSGRRKIWKRQINVQFSNQASGMANLESRVQAAWNSEDVRPQKFLFTAGWTPTWQLLWNSLGVSWKFLWIMFLGGNAWQMRPWKGRTFLSQFEATSGESHSNRHTSGWSHCACSQDSERWILLLSLLPPS